MKRLWKFLIVMICVMLWVPAMAEAQILKWDPVLAVDTDKVLVFSCHDQAFPETDTRCVEPVASIPHPIATYDISHIADQAWFRVTAVDTSGNESGFSRIVDNRPPPTPLGVRIEVQVSVTVTPLVE